MLHLWKALVGNLVQDKYSSKYLMLWTLFLRPIKYFLQSVLHVVVLISYTHAHCEVDQYASHALVAFRNLGIFQQIDFFLALNIP